MPTGNWEAFANACAAKYKVAGTIGDCITKTYYLAVDAGFVGHMRQWRDEVMQRAGRPLESEPDA